MKNILKISTIALCFLSLTLASNLIAENGNTRPKDGAVKSDWLQYSRSAKRPVTSKTTVNAEGEVVEGVVVGGVTVKTEIVHIRCCRAIRNKDAWCDMALQDKKC